MFPSSSLQLILKISGQHFPGIFIAWRTYSYIYKKKMIFSIHFQYVGTYDPISIRFNIALPLQNSLFSFISLFSSFNQPSIAKLFWHISTHLGVNNDLCFDSLLPYLIFWQILYTWTLLYHTQWGVLSVALHAFTFLTQAIFPFIPRLL